MSLHPLTAPTAALPAAKHPNGQSSPWTTSKDLSHPGRSSLPKTRRWGTGTRLLLVLGTLLVVGSGAGAAWIFLFQGLHGQRPDLVLHTVKREKLRLTIVERGTLESADNHDVICLVKAG